VLLSDLEHEEHSTTTYTLEKYAGGYELTSQHFGILYVVHGQPSPPNISKLIIEVNVDHGPLTSQHFQISYGGYRP